MGPIRKDFTGIWSRTKAKTNNKRLKNGAGRGKSDGPWPTVRRNRTRLHPTLGDQGHRFQTFRILSHQYNCLISYMLRHICSNTYMVI